MTDRLYYTQPALREFDATVVSAGDVDSRPFVILDRTSFYPTSGGQPYDTGLLNDARVVEVLEREEDGAILHVLERPLSSGVAVHGVIDWSRRFDHMQQHTGQHILSAAFDRLHGARTVGFHLGADVSTLDLSREVNRSEIESAEDASNQVVWNDVTVAIRFADAGEAASLPLRKETAREGTLRIIEVSGFDMSACGGTHVARTGEIGNIHILSAERFRQGARIEFVCGGRTVREFRRMRDAVAGCIRSISVAPEELPAALERIQAENKDLRKTIRTNQEQIARFEAIALADRAKQVGQRFVVAESVPQKDAALLKVLASEIASRPGYDAALFSVEAPYLVVVVRSPGGALDAGTVLKRLIEQFGGKGGGRGEIAQGGGLTGDREKVLEEAKRLLAASEA